MSTSESYPIVKMSETIGYHIIVTSIATSIATSTSDNLNEYDNLWTARFLYEGNDIANLKD
ncbi:hypothetical protein RhiirC2_773076 [Rhizophagus irregularis]|uniref:Uncharacterized protein n=1 Tax=Rhizophagus irregularis TaxID=588596 RepID=A0A2N1NQ08_9GLOM|nr:hypothetical protein RhiirC2_773076 [Rhizophagus irregularis]